MTHLATAIGFLDAGALALIVTFADIRRNLPAIIAALHIKGR